MLRNHPFYYLDWQELTLPLMLVDGYSQYFMLTFSFCEYPYTTGEGGIVSFPDASTYEKAKILRTSMDLKNAIGILFPDPTIG